MKSVIHILSDFNMDFNDKMVDFFNHVQLITRAVVGNFQIPVQHRTIKIVNCEAPPSPHRTVPVPVLISNCQLRCFDEVIYEYVLKFLIRRDFAFMKELNKFIQIASASGLIKKWYKTIKSNLNINLNEKLVYN